MYLSQVQGLRGGSGFSQQKFSSTWSGLAALMRQRGFQSLFAGLSINYLKVVPSTAIGFTVYDAAKQYLKENPKAMVDLRNKIIAHKGIALAKLTEEDTAEKSDVKVDAKNAPAPAAAKAPAAPAGKTAAPASKDDGKKAAPPAKAARPSPAHQ